MRVYDGHLIIQEAGNFNQKINVILYSMDNYMAFMLGKKLSFY